MPTQGTNSHRIGAPPWAIESRPRWGCLAQGRNKNRIRFADSVACVLRPAGGTYFRLAALGFGDLAALPAPCDGRLLLDLTAASMFSMYFLAGTRLIASPMT